MSQLNTHNYVLKNSVRHGGKLITRVPVSYLKWMVNISHTEAKYAKAELERRGTTTPTLDLSGHAIDRASMNCLDQWRRCRNKDEGIYSWLVRMAQEALEAKDMHKGKFVHQGMMFAIERDGEWPVVKTVMRYEYEPRKERDTE